MELQSCFYPQYIQRISHSVTDYYKPYLRQMSVPCGHCPACLNNRMLGYVSRLKEESRKHKFTYHVTLTYAEECVHTISFYHDKNQEKSSIYALYDDKFTDVACKHRLVFDVFDNPHRRVSSHDKFRGQVYDDAKRLANNESKYGDNKLRYVERRDLQLFFKRLRRQLEYHYGIKEQIRYYAALEYSPEKLRPHWHVLLWFESPEISRNISKLVSENWQNGFTKCKYAVGRTASYVAKYINCVNLLPQIYMLQDFKSIALFSKRPAIGVSKVADSQIKEMFYNRTFDWVIKDGQKVKDYVFTSAFESRWMPKCREFDKISHNERVARYTYYSQVQSEIDSHINEVVSPKDCIPSDRIVKAYHSTNCMFDDDSFSILGMSDYYLSRRVYQISNELKMSVDNVVSVIEDYYSHKKLKALKAFYNFQVDFMNQFPNDLEYLACLYPTDLQNLKQLDKFKVYPLYYDSLVSFACSFGFDVNDIPEDLHFSTRSYQDEQIRFAHDNVKTKKFYEKKNIKQYFFFDNKNNVTDMFNQKFKK